MRRLMTRVLLWHRRRHLRVWSPPSDDRWVPRQDPYDR